MYSIQSTTNGHAFLLIHLFPFIHSLYSLNLSSNAYHDPPLFHMLYEAATEAWMGQYVQQQQKLELVGGGVHVKPTI